MAWIRAAGPERLNGRRIHVYGLDADLIVLCLLHYGTVAPGATWRVLREKQEFGKVGATTGAAETKFLTLDINGLTGVLFPDLGARAQQILDYVCGMSLLGNDFLPHGIGVNIREGGHDRLVAALADLHAAGGVLTRGGQVDLAGLRTIIAGLATTEAADTLGGIQTKYRMRGPPPRTDAERAMLPVQNLPLEWRAEDRLWSFRRGVLHEDWSARYYEEATQRDIEARCRTWLVGLQWILDYYTGKPVSTSWLYPWVHPPLWSDIALYLDGCTALPGAPAVEPTRVQPQEQLAVVLPLESWGLIRDPWLRAAPVRLPAYWPKSFAFESLGKRWLWECEPRIPLLTIGRLRAALRIVK
jgi:5'-3' exonuclease